MNVAMIGWEFPPFMAGGLGIHCLELTTELAKTGMAIEFYMPHMSSIEGPMRVAHHHRHLRIVEVEADPAMNPYGGKAGSYDENFNASVVQYNERVLNAFDSWDADVVHVHDWITIPAGLEVARRGGLPLVVTIHSTEYDRSAGFFPQPWIIDIERRGVREADAVIGVSGLTRQQLVERYGAPPDRTFAVHNGVNFENFLNVGRRDYARDSRNVLYLARVSRQKGPLFFMEAARIVAANDPTAHFIVAGKGEMIPEMIAKTLEWGISDRVTFAGYVPDAELARFYEMSDVYVLPSVSEPFGISVLEAMTTGVPAIVSKTTGVGEALSNVLKVDYWDTWEIADAVLRLLDSKPMRRELGRNGALEVRKFTWAECGRKTRAVYEWAAKNPRPPMEATA